MNTALDRAIAAAGGVSQLASRIGVVQTAVSNWRKRENVPAEHCPRIERETRRIAEERGAPALVVTCEQLRPDVAWDVLRMQAQPEQQAA